MRRRLIVEVEVADTVPGAMLDVITILAGKLEEMKEKDELVDYGIALETDATTSFRSFARIVKCLEEAEK